MSSIWNGPYQAPKGYDLRAPYNVPMGQIQELRVVPPFSTASIQKNTVVGALPCRRPFRGFPGSPCLHPGRTYHNVASFQPCTLQPSFDTVENQHPPYSELVMEKLYLKNSRIK